MIPFRFRCVVLCLALAACDKKPKMVTVGEALPNLPLPPGATYLGRAGGAEAMQVTVRSPAPVQEVTAYYRQLFQQGGWRLVNDARDGDGAVVLLAQQKGPPLWVRIRNADPGPGTVVELSGAVVPPSAESAPSGSAGAAKPSS